MAFPTSNLSLSTVLAGYGRTGGINGLRGVQAWNSNGTSITAPSTGNFSLLTTFGGRYPYNTNPRGQLFTGTNMAVPTGAIKFVVVLIGGGGGGGGAGGSYDTNILGIPVRNSGGAGGGGAGGGLCVTPVLMYNASSFQNASVTFPIGGGGGQNGFGGNNTADGIGGNSGTQASFTYNGQTYAATGGVGGGGGQRGTIDREGGNGGGGSPGGSFSGPGTTSPQSFNGANGSGRTAGFSGGGTSEGQGGNGADRGGGYGNNGGNGAIYITWYFI
jgi:hypothetical protein